MPFFLILVPFYYATHTTIHYPIKTTEYNIFATFIDEDFKQLTSKLTPGGQYELYVRYANALRQYIRTLPGIEVGWI